MVMCPFLLTEIAHTYSVHTEASSSRLGKCLGCQQILSLCFNYLREVLFDELDDPQRLRVLNDPMRLFLLDTDLAADGTFKQASRRFGKFPNPSINETFVHLGYVRQDKEVDGLALL